MNFKNRKNLMLLLIIVGVSTTIISGFTPITTWDSGPYFEQEFGISDPAISLTLDNSYILTHRYIKDLTSDFSSEFHTFKLLNFVIHKTGNPKLYETLPELTDYEVGNTGLLTKTSFNIVGFFIGAISLIALFCLTYFSIKSIGKKKIYFLYIALGEIFILGIITIGNLYESMYLNSSDLSSGLSIGYGFYIAVFSICLFLFLYFKQDLILGNKNELNKETTHS